ncbi:MAG: histidine kinase dimerization/phospho-acceptor domain-containing protein [Oscillospiraceae bacterium]
MTAKIFRNAFLIGFTVLLACILLFFFIMYSNYQAQAFDNLAIEAEHISEGMQICGGESYLSAVQSGERITWIAADGSVLYDNMADSSTMENHLQRPEVAEAFETGSGRSDRYSSTILEKNNYYALLLKDGTVLRVAGKQTSLAAMALMLVQPSLWIVVLVLVLCGLLAMRLARQIVRPINAINPDNPNATPTYPELQPLITRLQEQNRTIRTQLSELSTRQREFDAITENMREGFLIVDNKCSILSSNRSALRLLGIDDAQKPENLHQAVCSGKLLDLVDNALAGTRGDEEITVGGGTWQLFANPVITAGHVTGAIIIFMDVTEREQREALRREFSANVSHELKTPLTSITGFAELMKEGMVPKEKMQEFSGDIYRESRRLIDLVDDIIQLSRLDEGTANFSKSPVDLYTLSGQVIESLRPVAQKQDITLTLSGQHAVIEGVEQLLQEMIYNLCDNAIKYNISGGSVTVSVWQNGQTVTLSVVDTGIGIPYADQAASTFLPRRQEPLKEVGGTGLGLSIVKHAAQYHGASSTQERPRPRHSHRRQLYCPGIIICSF